MRRRDFIKRSALVTGGVLCIPYAWGKNKPQKEDVTFAISTDIHRGMLPDVDDRLDTFLKEVEKRDVDFMIDLGDFCLNSPENAEFVKTWQDAPVEKYNVLGNHDMDRGTKEEFMEFIGMKKRYYSFDKGGVHFIVLDPNNLLIDGKYVPYGNANFYRPAEQRAYIDPEQMAWLKEDIKKTNNHCVIFSHQSFENPKACKNQKEVRAIFEAANEEAGFTKVIAAFSGHDHTDYAKEINGIQYIQINSMTYNWVGSKYQCKERYSEEINKKYPHISKTIPYKDPLFAFVTIKNNKLVVDGVQSTFIEPGPEKLGLAGDSLNGLPLRAEISDRKIKF
ncbi:hypothetical protein EYV94_03030 [Puteibacter caeruleilacunae]|nr:hypothetical protein EYV94_03030 [Puteibacter caeruleilacunae]